MALNPGTRLGAYEVISLVGAGGMGEVYRARDSRLGRDVAIKILPQQFTADPERRARFEREARLLATVSHPHIGGIYGLEEANGATALVLEFVEGQTLAERLKGGPMKPAEAIAVASQLADALDAAHQRQIVHRDLKPANIVLQRGAGRSADAVSVKVLDFGLATTGSDAADLDQRATEMRTDTGRILGTPPYMSPEQARGQVVDKRTDIWAFGCVLFEMLAGRRAFGGATVTDTLAQILEREPEWGALPRDTPAALRTLIERCLRKDPARRLRDIADARLEFDELPAATPAIGHKSRGAWIATSLGLIVLVAVIAVARFGRRQPAAELFEFPISSPANATVVPRYGGFRVAPDGRHLVVTVLADSRTSLWLRPIATAEYQQIPGTEDALFPFWRPDSLAIGFFSGGKLKSVPVRGGVPTVICDAPASARWEGSGFDEVGATWNSADVIVFMSEAFTLQTVSARSGSPPVPITSLATGEVAHRWPTFLPDGQHFLYIAMKQGGGAGDLRIAALDGGPPTSLGQYESNAVYADGHLIFLSGGRLVARPFDAAARRVTGPPVPLSSISTFDTWNNLGAFSVSASPASSVLAYYPGGPIPTEQRLAWRDRSGRLGSAFGETGRYTALDLSPDGKRVAVSFKKGTAATDIWVFDLARRDGVPLTTDPAWEFDPAWSPDGSQIAFNSLRTGGRFNLYSRPANGSGQDESVVAAQAGVETPAWSPLDGSILYADAGDLWIRSRDRSQPPSVVWKTKAREMAAAFSPDGRRIAYISDRSGRPELYLRGFPDGEEEQKVSVDGAMAPRWRADGKEIFFLSLDATLMAARLDAKGGASMAEPLFATGLSFASLRPYAVAGDGQRFLMPVAIGPAPPITAVLNWRERLPK